MRKLGKHYWRIAFVMAVTALFACHVAGVLNLPWLTRLESVLYDVRIKSMSPGEFDNRIVVVDIDEKSLRDKESGGEGRWPWRRDRLAKLVSDLFQKYGVTLVATDIILSEKDVSSGLEILDYLAIHDLKDQSEYLSILEKIRPSLSFDHLLGQAMKDGPVVLGYVFHNDKPSANSQLPPGLSPDDLGVNRLRAQAFPGYAGLLPELQVHSAGAGHLNPLRDTDGMTRRVPMLIEHDGLFYPSLSLAVVQTLTNASHLGALNFDYGQGELKVEKILVGSLDIPVDSALNALVPFRGAARSFLYVSASDVLQGRVPVDMLRSRIVLIGTTAAGMADLVTTPMGSSFPGVEVHANLITGMLDGRLVHAPPYAQGVELICVLLLGVLMLMAGIGLNPIGFIFFFGLVFTVTVSLNLSLLIHQQILLPLATPLATLVVIFVFQMGYGYLVESRGKRKISKLFASYVPPELVDKMSENPEAFNMKPIECELTVLFVDVRNFTSISENLTPPEQAELINVYLTTMSEVIRENYRGTLDKYIGDAVMAFWGAPIADELHAENSVLAAIEMQRQAQKLNLEFIDKGWPSLKIGVGINTGLMRVGDMGSNIRRAYTVMGDAVNLSSRLESLTKIYGVDILIGEQTLEKLDGWTCREVDVVCVKGKDKPVKIYEPIARSQDLTSSDFEELMHWSMVLSFYKSAQWHKAHLQLETLLATDPQKSLYLVFSKRLMEFLVKPPPSDWDGVTRFSN